MKRLLLLTIVFTLIFSSSSLAGKNFSAVVDRQLCYKDKSDYSSFVKRAQRLWNKLDEVEIDKAGADCPKNLVIEDARRIKGGYDGYYSSRSTPTITFSNSLLKKQDRACRRAIAVHEMGHALGLSHSTEGQVMWAKICASPQVDTIQRKDKKKYFKIWHS